MESDNYPLVLASTSPYRKSLLQRLQLDFETFAPEVDETPLAEESPRQLVKRLAQLKAQAAQAAYPKALIIGSDQIAVLGKQIIGKAGHHEQAVQQLLAASGQPVDFLTGLCLLNSVTQHSQTEIVRFRVIFRHLTLAQIENYLNKEKPYNCSGSFKSESLGISLLERMSGDDPTALIGLPLIRLVRMLENQGVKVI